MWLVPGFPAASPHVWAAGYQVIPLKAAALAYSATTDHFYAAMMPDAPAAAGGIAELNADTAAIQSVVATGSNPTRLAISAEGSVLHAVVNDGTALPGAFVTAEITEAHPYDMVARIV